jgi:hypothetical protein
MTKVGVYAIGIFTTLESNKSQFRERAPRVVQEDDGDWWIGSCTSTLRINRATQKPATMPPLHHHPIVSGTILAWGTSGDNTIR